MSRFDIVGYLAIIIIQGATFPALYSAIVGAATIPPAMPAMLSVGMLLLLVHSVRCKATVYIVSNAFGLCSNMLLLWLVL